MGQKSVAVHCLRLQLHLNKKHWQFVFVSGGLRPPPPEEANCQTSRPGDESSGGGITWSVLTCPIRGRRPISNSAAAAQLPSANQMMKSVPLLTCRSIPCGIHLTAEWRAVAADKSSDSSPYSIRCSGDDWKIRKVRAVARCAFHRKNEWHA